MRDDRNIFSSGVHESLDGTSLVDMLFDQFRDVRFLHPAVERSLRVHHHDGPHFAHSVAPGGNDEDLVSEPFFSDRLFESLRDFTRSAGGAPRAAADQDMGTINRHVSSSLR